MRVYVYPADTVGCGHHRMIWPAEVLAAAGHDVHVVPPSERRIRIDHQGDEITGVGAPEDADVMVFQRVTHRLLTRSLAWLQENRGIAVVVDVDDDLIAIHPRNPAFWALHPRGERADHMHSWKYLTEACRLADLVTMTTPSLVSVYGAHGRAVVIPNYLADHYYEVTHRDSDVIAYPAAVHSHPDDPQVTRPALARLVREGVQFRVVGNPVEFGPAFGLESDPPGTGPIDLEVWPRAVAAGCGIGIAPLADTRFNRSKSWLKVLELSACRVPWVASPRLEYARMHALGAGVLADKPKAWYRELRRLVDSEALRVEQGEANRAVAETLRLRDHAWRYLEAWELALNHRRGGTTRVPVVSRDPVAGR